MCLSGCITTAAATTGPARQPRPTSSTPATCTNPTRRSAFSSVRIAGTRVILSKLKLKSEKSKPARLAFLVLTPGRTAFLVLTFDFSLLTFNGVLHPRGLALQVAQVVELRAADPRRTHHFHLLNRRRVQREDPFDPLSERHLAHREGRAGAAAVQPDDDAFEYLNAFLVAFANFDVHAHGVARFHRRPLGQLR